MLASDRFPNFLNLEITFQQYPLGASAWIYHVAHLTGPDEEWIWLVAQGWLELTCLVPLFSTLCRKSRGQTAAGMLLIALFSFAALNACVSLQDLLVDTLLPLTGAAALLFAVKECREEAASPLWLLPMLLTTVQIKNSGIFFILPAILMLLPLLKKKPLRGKTLAAVLIPVLSVYLWYTHCLYVYPAAATTYHAMTAANFSSGLAAKSAETIREILSAVLKASFTGKTLVLFLAGTVLLSGSLLLAGDGAARRRMGQCLLLSLGLYLVYTVGMAGMYIFSMPEEEAVVLAGFDRYRMSVLILMAYSQLACFLQESGRLKMGTCLCAGGSAVLLVLWGAHNGGLLPAQASGKLLETRAWMEATVEQAQIPQGAACLVIAPEEQGESSRNVLRFLLLSGDVLQGTWTEGTEPEIPYYIEYVLLQDDDPALRAWADEKWPDQAGSTVIRLTPAQY